MPNVFCLIGVGGTGRGVLNHVKYELEQSFGGTEKARTVLLAIDGPPAPSQYALPGQYEIDCSPGSPEFYQLQNQMNPAGVIRRTARKTLQPGDEYVAAWLSPEEAAKIPTQNIEPEAGFGGQPTPGHAYVSLDAGGLKHALQRVYHQALGILRGQIGDDQHKQGQQVIVCLIGSHSGGTGSGLLWDIGHLLAELIYPNNDLLFCFIPWGKSYHKLHSSDVARMESDAKNFAGLLAGLRFMHADNQYGTYVAYNDPNKLLSPQLISVPFFIDGDGQGVKINNAAPQVGVVPVIADFLVSLIKDDSAAGGLSQNYINWALTYMGLVKKSEKFATLGSYSIRFPQLEVLETFAYKFTCELYQEILNPTQVSASQGDTEARQLVNLITFTQMLGDPTHAPLHHTTNVNFPGDNVVNLGSYIRVGHHDPIPPALPPLAEMIKLGWLFIRKSDQDVIDEAELAMGNIKNQVGKFLGKQETRIFTAFRHKLDEKLLDLFYHRDAEKWRPITLQENPRSIIMARDFLRSLDIMGRAFQDYVEEQFKTSYFPDGPTQPDLIAKQQSLVDAKKRIMHASSGKVKAEQEDFLQEATTLLRYQVWQMYFDGVKNILRELNSYINYLWQMIGDEADGWVKLLASYYNEMNLQYTKELSKRQEFCRVHLRQYLPDPGGAAEEQLFEEEGEPVLQALLGQMSWTLAIDENAPEEHRVTIILNSPKVEGFRYAPPARHVLDKATNQRVAVGIYDPNEHVVYARQKLRDRLARINLWKIMELDFRYDWLAEKKKIYSRLPLPEARQLRKDYIKDVVDRLITQTAPLLSLESNPVRPEGIFMGDFIQLGNEANLDQQPPEFTDQGRELAHWLATDLHIRLSTIPGLKNMSHPTLRHELRALVGYFSFPFNDWKYFHSAKTAYIHYHQDPNKVLINIYRPEQNALKIRQAIHAKLDHSFQDLLDPSVTFLLEDLEIFEKLSLCHLLNLIPQKRFGERLDAAEEYYLNHQTGIIKLATKQDLRGLYHIVCRQAFINKAGNLESNQVIQNMVIELWSQEEINNLADLAGFLANLEKQAYKVQCTPDQCGDMHSDHFEMAVKAIILAYVDRVRHHRNIIT